MGRADRQTHGNTDLQTHRFTDAQPYSPVTGTQHTDRYTDADRHRHTYSDTQTHSSQKYRHEDAAHRGTDTNTQT